MVFDGHEHLGGKLRQ